MDSRTRERYQKKASLLMHLIAGHYGALGPEADYAAIYREGMDAITSLALPVVIRQQAMKQRRDAEECRESLREIEEICDNPEDLAVITGRHMSDLQKPVSVPFCWHEHPERKPINDLLADLLEAPVDQWGIGRGLPAGDVQ